jgi:dihydropteroate synthase
LNLFEPPVSFFTKRRCLELGQRTNFVGILNLTPDSFSDGGDFVDHEQAEAHFLRMVEEGAEVIDIGGESTRPGHTPVSADEEISRVVPFIESIRSKTDTLISVDTSKAAVADAALAAGADILNDVWGAQRDPQMAGVIARHGAACILMHNRPTGEAGQGNVVDAIRNFLKVSLKKVLDAGVREDAILLDPGLGFGKTYDENWEIMRRLHEFKEMGYPILIGASRKSMIAKLLDLKDPKARLAGTLGTTALGVRAGVDFIRVHDVRENLECARVIEHGSSNFVQ